MKIEKTEASAACAHPPAAASFPSTQPRTSTLWKQASRREGLLVSYAVEKLGLKDGQAFLNGSHSFLDGAPLRMALASEEGAAAVRRAIDDVVTGKRSGAI